MRTILSHFITWYNTKKLLKRCQSGRNVRFSSRSKIYLQDGASSKQIVLDDEVWLYGRIILQSNGLCKLGKYVKIGNSTTIQCVNKVDIGDYTIVADNVVITDNNNHPISPSYRREWAVKYSESSLSLWKHSVSKPTIIEQNVWIGANSRICKGVRIGEGSIVAAGSIVTKDVPPFSIVAGNPARVVKTIQDE